MARFEEVPGKPYHYGWSNDLLVIVVDGSEQRDTKLRLAYFRTVAKGKTKMFWVRHNFNLSRCVVSNASSDLVVYEGGRSAFLKWDATHRQYTCLAK
jgi:hypothetical protein